VYCKQRNLKWRDVISPWTISRWTFNYGSVTNFRGGYLVKIGLLETCNWWSFWLNSQCLCVPIHCGILIEVLFPLNWMKSVTYLPSPLPPLHLPLTLQWWSLLIKTMLADTVPKKAPLSSPLSGNSRLRSSTTLSSVLTSNNERPLGFIYEIIGKVSFSFV